MEISAIITLSASVVYVRMKSAQHLQKESLALVNVNMDISALLWTILVNKVLMLEGLVLLLVSVLVMAWNALKAFAQSLMLEKPVISVNKKLIVITFSLVILSIMFVNIQHIPVTLTLVVLMPLAAVEMKPQNVYKIKTYVKINTLSS